MGYKTILSVVTDADLAERQLRQSAMLADGLGAHLDVLALGVDRTQTGYYYAGANAMVLQETLNRAKEEAASMADAARAALKAASCHWSLEEGVVQLADVGRQVAARARFADLVVSPKPYGSGRGAEIEPVIEGALFDGQAPVLVLPQADDPPVAPRRILLAWNESPEAVRAARAAMPLLIEAAQVQVVIIDPPRHGPDRSDPGGMLAQFLARHGARVEIDVLSKTLPRVSDVLIRHAGDIQADMIVMGAYGHSRFREAILGGATRNMLEQTDLAVFMAH